MLRRGFAQLIKTKRNSDECILRLQGDFSARNAKDVRDAFSFDYRNRNQIKSFSIASNESCRLSDQERDFLLSAIFAYNRTFPEKERLQKEVDSFSGSEKKRRFWVEIILRSLLLGRFQGKVQMTTDAVLRYMSGKKIGTSDYILHQPVPPIDPEAPDSIHHPLLIVTHAKSTATRGTPLELAACSNLFELYAYYWETVEVRGNQPLFGAVTDLNSWIFQKYDGTDFYMCDESLKACSHLPALEDLSRVIFSVLESGKNAQLK